MSKGSDLRPRKVDKKTFDKNSGQNLTKDKRKKEKQGDQSIGTVSYS